MAQRKTAGLAEAIERELRTQLGKSVTPTNIHLEREIDYNQLGRDRPQAEFKTRI